MSGGGETRAALLTPPGTGAIAVIRLYGAGARAVLADLFRGKQGSPPTGEAWNEGRLRYGVLVHDGEPIDDVIVAAATESGMPALDISAHGGVRVLERIFMALEARGVGIEDGGAGGPRIFPCSNPMEREVLEALGRARTARGVAFLARQREGLVRRLQEIRALWAGDAGAARRLLAALRDGAAAAMNLVDGVAVVLVGAANSGKSTLFNRLVGRPAALVSPRAGTTRDWVTAEVEMEGWPVRLIDTAGIRAGADALEGEAIARGQAAAGAAAVRLVVVDGAAAPDSKGLLPAGFDERRDIVVLNKMDLCGGGDSSPARPRRVVDGLKVAEVSAARGDGVAELVRLILHEVRGGTDEEPALAFFTQRQIEAADELLRAEAVGSAEADALFSRLVGVPAGVG